MKNDFFAEREGFEPPEPFSSTVFKTAAIDQLCHLSKQTPTKIHNNFGSQKKSSCKHKFTTFHCINSKK